MHTNNVFLVSKLMFFFLALDLACQLLEPMPNTSVAPSPWKPCRESVLTYIYDYVTLTGNSRAFVYNLYLIVIFKFYSVLSALEEKDLFCKAFHLL